jgi:UDP-N-acetylglucosamine 2-epimerase (non-hydrolysing)
VLEDMRAALTTIETRLPLLFPVYPRTRKRIQGHSASWKPVRPVDSLGYLDFLALMAKARLVLTDSGGIQEETAALGVPCATMREYTERSVTVLEGTNQPAETSRAGIETAAVRALNDGVYLLSNSCPLGWSRRENRRYSRGVGGGECPGLAPGKAADLV